MKYIFFFIHTYIYIYSLYLSISISFVSVCMCMRSYLGVYSWWWWILRQTFNFKYGYWRMPPMCLHSNLNISSQNPSNVIR